MRILRFILWKGHERRLRAGWRILLLLTLYAGVFILIQVARLGLARGNAQALLGTALYLGLGLCVVGVAARVIDRRRLADYGFHLDRA